MRKVVFKHFAEISDVFDFYASIGDGDAFSIQVHRSREEWRKAA